MFISEPQMPRETLTQMPKKSDADAHTYTNDNPPPMLTPRAASNHRTPLCLPQCLVTCGKGYKHRQTWCQFGEDRLDDRFCDSSKPESVQTCQQQECASWQVGHWGQVRRSLG